MKCHRGSERAPMYPTFKTSSRMKSARRACSKCSLPTSSRRATRKFTSRTQSPTPTACSTSTSRSRKSKNRRCVTVWQVTRWSTYMSPVTLLQTKMQPTWNRYRRRKWTRKRRMEMRVAWMRRDSRRMERRRARKRRNKWLCWHLACILERLVPPGWCMGSSIACWTRRRMRRRSSSKTWKITLSFISYRCWTWMESSMATTGARWQLAI